MIADHFSDLPRELILLDKSVLSSIVRFNGNTGAAPGTFATAPGLFPEGLVFGPDGNLYVSDESNNYVLRFNGTTGALIGTFASGRHLNFPTGLTSRGRGGRSPIPHLPHITPEH